MATNALDVAPHEAEALVGSYRRIGDVGPVYEIIEVDGDDVKICLVESGRIERYPLAEAMRDPGPDVRDRV